MANSKTIERVKLEINLMKFGLKQISQTYNTAYEEDIIQPCLEYFRDGATLILEKEKELKELLSAETDNNSGNENK